MSAVPYIREVAGSIRDCRKAGQKTAVDCVANFVRAPPVPAEFDYLRPALPPGVQGQGDVTVREQAPTILATEQDAAFRSRVAALEPKRARWMELADKRASYAYLRKQAEDNFRAFDPPRDPKDYEIGPHLAAGEQIELSELDKLFVGTTG